MLPNFTKSFWWQACLLLAAVFFAACEHTPNPCAEFTTACISVTVNSGPADVYRISVHSVDNIDDAIDHTPKQPALKPLNYPLRFAIQYGEFQDLFQGHVDLMFSALSQDYDVLGQARAEVAIKAREKTSLQIDFGPVLEKALATSVGPALLAPKSVAFQAVWLGTP